VSSSSESLLANPANPAEQAEPDLLQAFAALQSLLLTSPSLDAFLDDVAGLAAGVVPGASCGITIRRNGQPLTVASSDERAEKVDEVQYGAGEGPCLDTLRTGAVVDVPDLATEGRWDRYRPHAAANGVRCSLSLPLGAGADTVGALNLYGYRPGAFDLAARGQAELFAAQAAAALTLVLRTASLVEDRANLEQALTSRTIIDQAIGILMAQQRCTAAAAFALLRAHSQNNNRKLRVVAADLITQVSGERPAPAHRFHRSGTPVE
jgi:GAF domain-containing protein